jgi:hypothetical protein
MVGANTFSNGGAMTGSSPTELLTVASDTRKFLLREKVTETVMVSGDADWPHTRIQEFTKKAAKGCEESSFALYSLLLSLASKAPTANRAIQHLVELLTGRKQQQQLVK